MTLYHDALWNCFIRKSQNRQRKSKSYKKKQNVRQRPVSDEEGCRLFPLFAVKNMKRILAFAVLAVSCGLAEVEKGERPESDDVWNGADVSLSCGACYITAMDYRPGYDWRSDTEMGTVKCSLAVFADGIPVLKIPVGDEHEVSSDPMRHRLIGGHVYTDYTDGTTSVVKMDGKVLYRYDGAEEVEDMAVRGGQVHSICSRQNGDGFCYRINGHKVLERESGNLMGNLSVWKDTVCFCFRQPVASSSGVEDAYYISKDGKVSKIHTADDVSEVWDMTAHEGEVAMAVSYNNSRGPVLVYGMRSESIGYVQSLDVVSCRFLDSPVLAMNVRCTYPGSNQQSDLLWSLGRSWKMYMTTQTLSCSYVDDTGFNAAINPKDGKKGLLFKGNISYMMPEGYCIKGRSPLGVKDDVLYAGLTSLSTSCPAVWRGGVLDTLKVNGPITGLTFLQ